MNNAKHTAIVLLTAVAVSAAIFLLNRKPAKRFSSKTFLTSSGWGYDILVNDKLFIHQESIPAYAGKDGFPKKEQAEKTAALIINKMKRSEPPMVTTFEIQQICPLHEPGDTTQRKF